MAGKQAKVGGVDMAALIAALEAAGLEVKPKAQPKRRSKRQSKSEFHATVTENPSGKAKSDKAKLYGRAPTVEQPGNGLTAAQHTHKARLDALEQAIPGITKVAYVFSIGKDANKKLCKNLALCVNVPFTYIELPDGKNQVVGNLTPDELRAKIKACGYGFTRQKDSDRNGCFFWACDSKGYPVRRQMGRYAKLNAAANLVNADE